MSIKVIFPPGATRLSVNGLHQWDYGRKIEIHADDLPALVEVHFACDGMEEAVVRSCAVINGVAEAAVPDLCLEQTTPVTAWVYEVGETSGETVKTIILPITPRTKPQPSADIPEDVSDKYTEAVAAMSELVEEFEGRVAGVIDEVEDRIADALYDEGWTAKYAEHATSARRAAALTPDALLTNSADNSHYTIDYTGLYVVVFQSGPRIASAIIAITDLGSDSYGTDTKMGQPVYEELYKTLTVYDADGNMLPITAVYLIADSLGGADL